MPIRVLCIDDDARLFELLASYLEPNGVCLVHAADGQKGLAALSQGVFEAVLLDVMMPGLDGLDTMRIVRNLDGYRQVPIVAVTAKAMVGDREKCIQAGAWDYLSKPVDMVHLLAVLRGWLHR